MVTTAARTNSFVRSTPALATALLCLTLATLSYIFGQSAFSGAVGSGVAIIVIGVMFAFFGDDQFDMFSPAFFIGISFALFYGFATLAPTLMPSESAPLQVLLDRANDYVPEAAYVSFWCLLCLIFGYQLDIGTRLANTKKWFVLESRGSDFWFWLALSLTGGLASLISIISGAYLQTTDTLQTPLFYSAVGFFTGGIMFAAGFALYLALRPNGATWRVPAVFSVLLVFGIMVPTGSKSASLFGMVVVGLAWNYARQRFSRRFAVMTMIGLMGLLVVFLPFNVAYRALSLSEHTSGYASDLDRVAYAFDEVANSSLDDVVKESTEYFSQRFSNITIVGIILESQHNGLETSIGDSSYMRAVYSVIPRFIWAEKPALAMGREVAVKLGLGSVDAIVLGAEMSNTSVGLTLVGEAIYNLPSFLAPLVFVFVGIFLKWGYTAILLLFRYGVSLAGAFAAFFWIDIVFAMNEANLASVVAGAVKYMIFLWILLKVLGYRKKPVSSGVTTSVAPVSYA